MDLDTNTDGNADVAQDTSQEIQQEAANPTTPQDLATEYKPFASGKEKFKIDDKEEEWDWNTTKKYAQLGKSSYSRLEQAANIQKQARSTYSNLMKAAQNDPEGLIRMLNPQFQGFPKAQGPGEQATGHNTGVDPKDQKLSEIESKLQSYEEKIEAQAIAEERKAVETELDGALKEYPQLNNKFLRSYVKSQYLQALKSDLHEITLSDVAFQVAQEWDGIRSEERKAKQQKIEENKRRAPVGTVPGKQGEKPMGREDVLRLAGRIP